LSRRYIVIPAICLVLGRDDGLVNAKHVAVPLKQNVNCVAAEDLLLSIYILRVFYNNPADVPIQQYLLAVHAKHGFVLGGFYPLLDLLQNGKVFGSVD
jgi:hypothetical protein